MEFICVGIGTVDCGSTNSSMGQVVWSNVGLDRGKASTERDTVGEYIMDDEGG